MSLIFFSSRRRHTRSKRDWSSDVCSSDLSYYQEEYGVSRGTIQNAFRYLKEAGAVELVSHGHMGTYIEKIDYVKLQDCKIGRASCRERMKMCEVGGVDTYMIITCIDLICL